MKTIKNRMPLKAEYENIDGKTVITFKGTATEKGKEAPSDFEKEFVYDFILTKKINHTSEGE